jgi:hypothetical protein
VATSASAVLSSEARGQLDGLAHRHGHVSLALNERSNRLLKASQRGEFLSRALNLIAPVTLVCRVYGRTGIADELPGLERHGGGLVLNLQTPGLLDNPALIGLASGLDTHLVVELMSEDANWRRLFALGWDPNVVTNIASAIGRSALRRAGQSTGAAIVTHGTAYTVDIAVFAPADTMSRLLPIACTNAQASKGYRLMYGNHGA